MKNAKYAILDFEFTGLDNSFISNNEILETKIAICDAKFNILESKCWTHKTDKPNGAGSFLVNKIKPEHQKDEKFSKEFFEKEIGEKYKDLIFVNFAVSMDNKMLSKYGVETEITEDIQEWMMLSEYELRLATEGHSLECCYYLATGKVADIKNHKGVDELSIIAELAKKLVDLSKNQHLNFMPWGFCAGMPIQDYVYEYRRNADGYRYNNMGILSESLTLCAFSSDEYASNTDDNDEY